MMRNKQITILILILIALLSAACVPGSLGGAEILPAISPGETAGATPVAVSASPTSAVTTTPAAAETSTAGMPATGTTATTVPAATATPIQVLTTEVQYVMGLVDLNLRSGPGLAHQVVGWMTHGQIAPVTGMSSDGNWWQLDCPSNNASYCWVSAGSQYTQPEPGATRLQFAPGATSETLTGTIDGQTQIRYVLRAAAGQTMVVQVSSSNDSVLFHLQGLHDGQVYKHLLNGESSWQGKLSQTQDYLLALNGAGETTTYSVYISITNGPAELPTPTATATGSPIPGGPLYPVVDAQSGYLLGGTKNGTWIDAQTYATYLQDTDRPYNLYAPAGYQGSVTGSPPVSSGICSQPVVALQPATNLAGAVGLVATWDATPRLAHTLPAGSAPYPELIASLLVEKGLNDPEVLIDKIQKVDLEGDGVDEVLITASRLSEGTSTPAVAAGDYSLVLLRKTKGDVTTTVPLAVDVYPEANELAYPYRYDVLGLMDLSGDGWLEIMIEADRYEGRMVTAYEVTYAGLQSVLQAGCEQ